MSQKLEDQSIVLQAKKLIEDGDCKGLDKLIKVTPNFNSVADTITLLMSAMYEEQHECLQLLVESGVDINARNSVGFTPLIVSLLLEDERSPLLLMKYGADINITHEKVPSLLFQAVQRGSSFIPVIRELIARGSNPRIESQVGLTPLWLAQKNKNDEIVEILLESLKIDPEKN